MRARPRAPRALFCGRIRNGRSAHAGPVRRVGLRSEVLRARFPFCIGMHNLFPSAVYRFTGFDIFVAAEGKPIRINVLKLLCAVKNQTGILSPIVINFSIGIISFNMLVYYLISQNTYIQTSFLG